MNLFSLERSIIKLFKLISFIVIVVDVASASFQRDAGGRHDTLFQKCEKVNLAPRSQRGRSQHLLLAKVDATIEMLLLLMLLLLHWNGSILGRKELKRVTCYRGPIWRSPPDS